MQEHNLSYCQKLCCNSPKVVYFQQTAFAQLLIRLVELKKGCLNFRFFMLFWHILITLGRSFCETFLNINAEPFLNFKISETNFFMKIMPQSFAKACASCFSDMKDTSEFNQKTFPTECALESKKVCLIMLQRKNHN